MNPATLAETAERMKSMKPQDIDGLLSEMASMSSEQKAQLKAMGMDPGMMERSMKMMRDNPSIMASAQKMMEKMSPAELQASSKLAQEQMASMSPEQMEQAAKAMAAAPQAELDASLDAIKSVASVQNSAKDPALIDAMFKAAEYMSRPPTGGVTFRAFASAGPVAALRGARETDLSESELQECWQAGTLGAPRADRAAFERAWREVSELFEGDIMDEARDPYSAEARAGLDVPARSPVDADAFAGMPPPTVGAGVSAEQMAQVSEQVKAMGDGDLSAMLDQMSNMGPAEEARLREMGVDPAMMRKSVAMMQSNPLMRKAAQAMVSKMSPDQLKNAGQAAQKQMATMSKEQLDAAMDNMKKDAEEK